jgi:hypothetical protein
VSAISDQSILQDQTAGPLNFMVDDGQVSAANLQLTATSSNLGLIPIQNILFAGGGANRTITATPLTGQTVSQQSLLR